MPDQAAAESRRVFVPPQELARSIASRGDIALFLDVDGTLLPIRALPTDVRADEPLGTLLASLHGVLGGALGLVSGRTIEDLDRIFKPMSLPAAGTHGAELRFADGTREIEAPDLLDDVRPVVGQFVAERSGLLLEDKGRTLAVHFRQRPELEEDVLRTLTMLVSGRDLVVQRGKMVAELKPAGIDKGRAIARLMTTAPFLGRRPVFFGDDVTDESGFRYVNSVGGSSVRVGALADATSAEWRLPDVDAVLVLLQTMCSAP